MWTLKMLKYHEGQATLKKLKKIPKLFEIHVNSAKKNPTFLNLVLIFTISL